ncbi:MAG: hypothetical protein QXP70_03005, partial [Methanomassiliicoccales archaeon]
MGKTRVVIVSIAVALLFVLSAVLFVPHAGLASPTMRSNQTSGLSALRTAPLAQVSGEGAASGSVTNSLGQYTIVSEPENLSAQITATISLKADNGLSGYLSAVNNPESPLYRHFLTPSEIG